MGRVLLLLCILVTLAQSSAVADDAATCGSASGDEAIAACSRMIDSGWYRGPSLAVIHSDRGLALYRKGDYDAAINDLSKALRLDPMLAVAYSNRGLVWHNKKNYDRALQDLNEAIRLDPKLPQAYKNRALTWLTRKDYERSLADFDAAIRLNPQPEADDYLGRGLARIQKKDYDRAIADFDQAIRLNPQPSAVYYFNRSRAWIEKKNYDRGIADLDQAIRLNPNLGTAYNNRGFAYNNKGEFDRAIADLDKAITLDPKSAAPYKNRGISYEKKGELEKALADFRRALDLDNRNQEAREGIQRIGKRFSDGVTRTAATPQSDKNGNPYVHLPPDKIIEQARSLERRMAESNKPKPITQIVLVEKKEVEQTTIALESIDRAAPQYTEAQMLLQTLKQRGAEGKQAMQAAVAKAIADDVDGRKAYAKLYEHNALMAGYSVTVSTSGPKATTLNLSYALLTKASIYQLINDEAFREMLRQKGFAKLHITDGYNWSGNVDLK
jgi:tetratricopeptide (TPR) repeat protein